MKNIVATGSGVAANFQGLPEMNLQNVSLENAILEAKKGITAVDTDGLILKNIKVIPSTGSALTLYNTKHVKVDKLTYQVSDSISPIRVLGSLSQDIHINTPKTAIEIGGTVPEGVVKTE